MAPASYSLLSASSRIARRIGASSSCVVRGMNANLQINDAVADAYPILSRHWPDFPYKLETGAVKGTPSPEHLAQRLDHIFAEPPP